MNLHQVGVFWKNKIRVQKFNGRGESETNDKNEGRRKKDTQDKKRETKKLRERLRQADIGRDRERERERKQGCVILSLESFRHKSIILLVSVSIVS